MSEFDMTRDSAIRCNITEPRCIVKLTNETLILWLKLLCLLHQKRSTFHMVLSWCTVYVPAHIFKHMNGRSIPTILLDNLMS